MTDYIIEIHVKKKNLDQLVSMIISENDFEGGLIENIEWKELK